MNQIKELIEKLQEAVHDQLEERDNRRSGNSGKSPRWKKFVKIVKNFNKAAEKEHELYMMGNCSLYDENCDEDTRKKLQKRAGDEAEKWNNAFISEFKDLISKKDLKEFSISHYDSSDPEIMADAWLGE
jgi:hypothetical protein